MKAELVIGSSGDIAKAVTQKLIVHQDIDVLITVSRETWNLEESLTNYKERDYKESDFHENNVGSIKHLHFICDYSDESVQSIVQSIDPTYCFRFIVICNGFLHGAVSEQSDTQIPEKRIEDFSFDFFIKNLEANALVQIRWISHLTKRLGQQDKSLPINLVVISARVASISDNQLGGWYSYRASKAALNMLIKTASIELARRVSQLKLVCFHPGTAKTKLSKPFQGNVPAEKLFSTEFVADCLIEQCLNLPANGDVSYIDWAGKQIQW